ncbi:hypothetical protein E2C01_041810 [Portunus trituberculatus]|uniref:Uncharacterized protein n=1 Tax=Portunus trituberculatus TaxID=210409 RepID=A0A5B7FUR2_PORTR|nr:hypothetical protein [Portunus trituberculatus]
MKTEIEIGVAAHHESFRISKGLDEQSTSKHVLNNPGHKVGDPGVHARIAWLSTPIPERHKPNLNPSATDEEKQRPATVSL